MRPRSRPSAWERSTVGPKPSSPTRKREHSRKPDEQYPLIEACSPGPYLELFARHPEPGWVAWGDEADEETVPRGKVHRDYAGGAIQAPHLASHERVEEETADEFATDLRRHYETGKSIPDTALETGYSISRVRSLLQRAETPLRSRGAPPNRDHDDDGYSPVPLGFDAE